MNFTLFICPREKYVKRAVVAEELIVLVVQSHQNLVWTENIKMKLPMSTYMVVFEGDLEE